MQRTIEMQRIIKHPPERVWKALTDARYLKIWYMENDFLPIVGHRFEFRTDPGPGFDGVIQCEVIEVDEPRHLAYRFRAGDNMVDTVVRWSLEPHEVGTLLKLKHSGFRGLQHIFTSIILQYGWWRFLRGLPHVISNIERGVLSSV